MSSVRLDKLLSNLGYGSRKEVTAWAKAGRVTDAAGLPLRRAADKVDPDRVRLDGQDLDPRELVLLLNKPTGYTCSHRDKPPLVYEILPPRFSFREPTLSCVGRLDKDTTGALLLTDHGQLLHRLTSPTWKLPKVYQVETSLPITDEQVARLAEGGWLLPGDDKPLAPAECRRTTEQTLELTLIEGRYHQVKRMLEEVGNPLTRLHRLSFAGLSVETLSPGEWRPLDLAERAGLMATCQLQDAPTSG